ncbi:MAG: PTS sugar transporter subunit IIA [Gammaproteobacteria bacterium]|nr:PTS sugar transporter subunit IIA [Gammaproteobacteria bacterium]
MPIQDLLSRQRIALGVPATSKDDLLRQLGVLLTTDADVLNAALASTALAERERLGSTGLGSGFALPHGRVKGLARPIGAFCTLAQPLDFAAIDHRPVTVAFALLVPEHANNEHLKILAELAGLFSDKAWREQLLTAKNAEELYQHLIQHRSVAPVHDTQAHRTRSV